MEVKIFYVNTAIDLINLTSNIYDFIHFHLTIKIYLNKCVNKSNYARFIRCGCFERTKNEKTLADTNDIAYIF